MSFELLADASSQLPATENIPVWGQILGGVTSFGFAVWCAYYMTKHAVPRLQKQSMDAIERQAIRHENNVNSLVEGHRENVNQLVANFRQELKDHRIESMELNKANVEAVNKVAKAVEMLTQHVESTIPAMRPIPNQKSRQ